MKRIKILLIALILILGGVFFSQVNAVNLKAQEARPFSDDNGDGTVGNDTYRFLKGTAGLNRGYTIFKLYEDGDTAYSKAYYCLRGRVGFGATADSDVTTDSIEYTKLGEMHENSSNIINKYKEYYNVDLNRTETITFQGINHENVNIYNAVLWILDNLYIPTDNSEGYVAEVYKNELLYKAGIVEAGLSDSDKITKDDLEVIQQLAIWYFTNYDQQSDEISVSRRDDPNIAYLLGIIKDGNNDSYDNNMFIGTRGANLNKLYTYLINSAIEGSTSYGTNEIRKLTTSSREFDKSIKLAIESKNCECEVVRPGVSHIEEYYYKIGPFKVGTNPRNTINSSDIILLDAQETVVPRYYTVTDSSTTYETYYFVDKDGKRVNTLQEGVEYYIQVKKLFTKDFKLGDTEALADYDMSKVTLKTSSSYSTNTADFFIRENADQPAVEVNKKVIVEGDEITVEEPKAFDLSLRKFITSIKRGEENIEVEDRTPKINTNTLINGIRNRNGSIEYTATYTHPKNALPVETGDKVIYTIRIYNEGDIDGTATEVTDYLPDGLELVPADESSTNRTYGWTSEDGKTIKTEYLKDTIIKAFDKDKTETEEGWQKAETGDSGLYYADVQVECKVVAQPGSDDQALRNIAAITADTDDDRDSVPGDPGRDDYNPPADNSTYKEDDDDYEDLVLRGKAFDLALRKYISSIKRNGEEVAFDDRTPKINTETLINGTFDRNGNKEYTATYEHSKEPLTVKKGDIITYTLRVYNEGDIDGYVSEITDYIPEGLALILNYNTNLDNGWKLPDDLDSTKIMKLVGTDGFYKTEADVKNLKLEDFSETINLSDVQLVTGKVAITTAGLKDELIKAFDKNKTEAEEGWQKANEGDGGLYYKDVQISCLVIAENTYKDVITNVAEISADKSVPTDIDDRDSVPDDKKDPYTTWQEDDDDYEPVVLRYFDLALRKFITGVETNGKTENITSRIPQISIDEETGNIKYTHPKEEAPVKVANNDVVIYTLRVYNEGTLAGYAEEITDDIPEGLIYLPDHDINKQYEWKMFDKDGKVTDKVDEAETIKTDYLSEEKEKTAKRDNLIDPFDSSKAISTEEPLNPDYKDVKVAFRVIEPNTSDRVIVNSAQISEDSDDDEDSDPHEWNEGEDDQDREYIYVKYFDLSLLKWVTQTIVTVDGKTTTTETGFKPNTGKTETTGIRDNEANEPVAKVELDKNKLSKTTVKFVYKIRITNEGEIAGYATEITDFIPKGLEFKAEDNKKYGWVKEGNDKVTTRALETVLLQPGESAEVEIVFTWKNDKNNLGLKTNIAEITEDYNEYNSPDIDSTPDNKKDPYEKEQEDDDDFALVILSLKTGKGMSYTLLITTVVTLLAGGIYLIKKYVLRF